jgi:putative PIN family toxin of toxin-antitoxin system
VIRPIPQETTVGEGSEEAPRIRAVLDANVVASVLVNPTGVPGQIVTSLFATSTFESIVSAATLAELSRCVGYPKLRPYIRMDDEALAQWIEQFAIVSTVVEDEPLPDPIVRDDPDDDLYFAVAVTGRAIYVVNGDSHLLGVGSYSAVTVVPPRQFLHLLDAPHSPTP